MQWSCGTSLAGHLLNAATLLLWSPLNSPISYVMVKYGNLFLLITLPHYSYQFGSKCECGNQG